VYCTEQNRTEASTHERNESGDMLCMYVCWVGEEWHGMACTSREDARLITKL
jgi:hypothetical protein